MTEESNTPSVPLVSRYDWTSDEGRSNSSEEYLLLVEHVARLIRDGAHALLAGNSHSVARTIVSHMAHKFEMGPPDLDELRRERGL